MPTESAASISSTPIAPARSNRHPSRPHRMTVLGASPVNVPPSRNTLTFSPSATRASPIVRAGVSPDRFALVAVIGRPSPYARARAIGCDDTRIPTPPSVPINASGIPLRAGITIVNGPGQNAFASRRAISGTSRPIAKAAAMSCAINAIVLAESRPLISKIRSSAAGAKASAAMP